MMPEISRKNSGRRVSPTARRIAAPKLYTIIAGIPTKMIRMYSTACSSTFSGVPMASSSGRASAMPRKINTTPARALMRMEVCTLSPTRFQSRAP